MVEETYEEIFKRMDKLAERSNAEKLFAEDIDRDLINSCQDAENDIGFNVSPAFERLFEKLNFIKHKIDNITSIKK